MTDPDFFGDFPAQDSEWENGHWNRMLRKLVEDGLVSWAEVAALVLGHLNPSQVGTSIATKKSFQRNYRPRETWRHVRQWHFDQIGQCADCGTRLELQADHMISKEIVGSVGERLAAEAASTDVPLHALARQLLDDALPGPEDLGQAKGAVGNGLADLVAGGKDSASDLMIAADCLENMTLRCRRCNVIRRPSHRRGGETFLTAESALMWLLFVKRPGTYDEFAALCREYGLTMANIRFEEAWAMAVWLQRAGLYTIEEGSKHGG